MDAVRASALSPTMHKPGVAPSKAWSDLGSRRPSSSMTSTSNASGLASDPSDGRCAQGETKATEGRRAKAERNIPSLSGESPANATRTVRNGSTLVQRRRSIDASPRRKEWVERARLGGCSIYCCVSARGSARMRLASCRSVPACAGCCGHDSWRSPAVSAAAPR